MVACKAETPAKTRWESGLLRTQARPDGRSPLRVPASAKSDRARVSFSHQRASTRAANARATSESYASDSESHSYHEQMGIPLKPTSLLAHQLASQGHADLPPLAFIDDEPFLLELQGSLDPPKGEDPALELGMDGVRVGKLNLENPVRDSRFQCADAAAELTLVRVSSPRRKSQFCGSRTTASKARLRSSRRHTPSCEPSRSHGPTPTLVPQNAPEPVPPRHQPLTPSPNRTTAKQPRPPPPPPPPLLRLNAPKSKSSP